MGRLLKAALFSIVALLVIGSPAMAYLYRSQVSIQETGGNNYAMLPLYWTQDNAFLASNGFMSATGQDTRVQSFAGQERKRMIADNKTLIAMPVNANTQHNNYFVTGESAESSMPIITGYNGFVTTPDFPFITNNGTIEMSGYFDTNSDNYTLLKDDAFSIYTISNNVIATIHSAIHNSANLLPTGVGTTTTIDSVAGAVTHWEAVAADDSSYVHTTASSIRYDTYQTSDITLPIGSIINSVTIYFKCRCRPYNNSPYASSALRTHSSDYFGSQKVMSDVYTLFHQTYTTNPSTLATWTLDEVNDMEIGVRLFGIVGTSTAECKYVYAVVNYSTPNIITSSLSGISSGLHTLSVSANTTHLILDVDGTSNSTALGGVSIPDTDTDIVWMQGNSMPYADNITVSIDGVTKLLYKPDSMIIGTALPDAVGSNHAVITWGTNPADISITTSGLTPPPATVPGATQPPATDILGEAGAVDWNVDVDMGKLATNPLRPAVKAISDNTQLSERQVWVFGGILIVVVVTVMVGTRVRGHHIITAVASGLATVAMVVMTIFPLYALIYLIICVIGGVISERSQQI